jgi:hypothetical protein
MSDKMKTDHWTLFNRRGFLKTAALLGGAAALDLRTVLRAGGATGSADSGQSLTTLSYVSDDGLVDARTLASGDSSLLNSGVRVTIEDYSLPDGMKPLFRGFVGVFIVANGGQSESVPFYAWAPTTPVKRSSFFMPVTPADGILFSVLTTEPEFPVESYYLTVDNAVPAARLRTGLYVFGSGYGRTGRIAPKKENGAVRLADRYDEPSYFEYLLIDIAREG